MHEGFSAPPVYRRGRCLLILAGLLAIGLAAPVSASATISSVFEGKVSCAEQSGANAGQRWCGTTTGTTVASWDGTPIDVTVGFPVATGSDANYPVVGIYQPWDGSKILPSSTQAQRWLKQGYAVFSMSDRGWAGSCKNSEKTKAGCEHGYIHLMSRRYEVRDAQYLLGLLADEGSINPQEIGAIGESYGGGMSVQLGSLKDRVELQNGELIPWTSPKGKPMRIAATAPEWEWTDFAQSLEPNGSNLDYVTEAPYAGVLGNHEFGIEKRNWNESLYLGGQLVGGAYYQAKPEEPEAAITEYYELDQTGGPYGGLALAEQQEKTLPIHGAYYTSLAEEPAPALLQNGWNDDLFPVDQAVDYYNKVRARYPHAAIQLFDLDFGHNPRSASSPSAPEVAALNTAQNEWFEYYVKGQGSEPAHAQGGVTAITSACTAETTATGVTYKATNWASLAAGEVNLQGAPEQTIEAPGTAPKTPFTSGTVCTTEANGENTSAATYKTAAAPTGGYTVAGSPTVIGEFSTPIKNDQVIARLLDVETGGTGKQRLIARAIYRPINPEGGFTKQVFQLHPQGWKVEAGHILKLQLLIQDSAYARTSPSTTTSAASIKVRNLELRVPTIETPGSDEGLITKPLPKYLPTGYTLARNVAPAAPSAPQLKSGTTPNNSGVFTLAWEPTQTAAEPSYTLQHKNSSGGWSTVASGLSSPEYAFTSGSPESEGTWTYRAVETNEGGESEPSSPSSEVKVDETPPNAPTATAARPPDYAGKGGWYKDSVEVSFSANGDPNLSDGSLGSGVNPASVPATQTFATNGSHEACGTVTDFAGNESSPGCTTVQVETTGPNLEISCPATAEVGQQGVAANYSASDEYSGLASDTSGTVAINTETAGVKTVSTTAVSNAGLENTKSCSTTVGYPKPGAPTLSVGSTPNKTGDFTLSWTGPNPMSYLGLSYTLQEHNAATSSWTTLASGIEALEYQLNGEPEGSWVYRVIGVDETHGQESEPSDPSSEVKVDETAPNAPTATAARPPDYAGKGGWYKDSVEVSFSANGDPNLSDGSLGSGVNPASVPATQTFATNGSHEACGTVTDFAGNESSPGCTTVQVETTGPNLEISCPAMVPIGASNVNATVTASDAYSGLKTDPSGSVPINTSKAGDQTVTRSAVSNLGLVTTRSCTTHVGYYVTVTGIVTGPLVVRDGEAVEVAPGAKVEGKVAVKAGGALDVEGATLQNNLIATQPALLRLCGSSIAGALRVNGSAGALVIGEGTSECEGNTVSKTSSVKNASQGLTLEHNTFGGNLTVTANAGGTTVQDNKITGSLTVLSNSGSVTDRPNEVGRRSRLQ